MHYFILSVFSFALCLAFLFCYIKNAIFFIKNNSVEALAAVRAILFSQELGLSSLILEGDSELFIIAL